MKTPIVPSGLRIPLACCALSWTLVSGMLAWSVSSTADQAHRLEQLQQQRMSSDQQLAEHLANATALDQALQLLAELRPLDAAESANAARPVQEAGQRWREYTTMLESDVLHEEALLDRVTAWLARSSVQHQIRACRLQRQEDGLFASCCLAALERGQ